MFVSLSVYTTHTWILRSDWLSADCSKQVSKSSGDLLKNPQDLVKKTWKFLKDQSNITEDLWDLLALISTPIQGPLKSNQGLQQHAIFKDLYDLFKVLWKHKAPKQDAQGSLQPHFQGPL